MTLDLARGDAVCVLGPSGSGKSTLLFILGALEPPTSGQVTLAGQDPSRSPRPRARRSATATWASSSRTIASFPSARSSRTSCCPRWSRRAGDHAARARALLEQVGLADRLDHRPGALSGGERQRTALARALVLSPTLLLCDEPTGNLDRKAADRVASMLLDLHAAQQTILVLVTHSLDLARRFPVRLELVEGALRPIP